MPPGWKVELAEHLDHASLAQTILPLSGSRSNCRGRDRLRNACGVSRLKSSSDGVKFTTLALVNGGRVGSGTYDDTLLNPSTTYTYRIRVTQGSLAGDYLAPPRPRANTGVERRFNGNIWTNGKFVPYGIDPVRHNAGQK